MIFATKVVLVARFVKETIHMNTTEKYNSWLDVPEADLRDELLKMTPDQIEEAFSCDIEFGTGGLRGILGAGTNRMNIYTIRKATQGFAQYICEAGEEAKKRGVVIAYDNRRKSKEFAKETAGVLAANGINAYVFESLRPTPELSFAVREMKAFGGVVITASHNPPEYNGYKLYDENGCQLVPRYTDRVIAIINSIENPREVKSENDSPLIKYIGGEIDEKYYEAVKTICVNPDVNKDDLTIVYSPQHGAGNVPVHTTLKNCGYKVVSVTEQCEPNEDFINTKNPNPETPEAFERAFITAKECDADLILTTDPDCDRVGAAVKHNGEYVRITGNQMGAVLLEYILSEKKAQGKLPENAIMINTIVTSDLGDTIAKAYGVDVEKTLTGFKFIGDRIDYHNTTDKKVFVFGYEESYGYLLGDFARDKDAVQATLIVSEAAAFYKAKGMTLYDALLAVYEKYGYFSDKLISVTKKGLEGAKEIRAVMKSLRENPMTQIGGEKIVKTEDYTTDSKAADHIPNADVIKVFTENGSWAAIRPSGTEPKCKFYFSARGESRAASEELLEKMTADVEKLM